MKKQILFIAMLFITCIANAQLISSSPLAQIKEQSGRYFRTGKDHSSDNSKNPVYAYFDITGLGTETVTIVRYHYGYMNWDKLPTVTMKKMPDGNYTNEETADKEMGKAILIPTTDGKYYYAQSDCRDGSYNCGYGKLAGLLTPDKGEAKKNFNTDYSSQMKGALDGINTREKAKFDTESSAKLNDFSRHVMETFEPDGYDKALKTMALTTFKNHFDNNVLPYSIIKIFALTDDSEIAKDEYNILPVFKYNPYMVVVKDTKSGICYAKLLYLTFKYEGGGIYSKKASVFSPSDEFRAITHKTKTGEKFQYTYTSGFSISSEVNKLDCKIVENLK